MYNALDFLLPYATGEESWPYPDDAFFQFAAYDIVQAAAYFGDAKAAAAVPNLQQPPGGGLWYMRPAAEQLDNINITG